MRLLPAGVIATLALDSDSNRSNGTIYNSHGTTPNQDIQVRCPGPFSFQWTWTVPSDAPVGQYYVNVTFNDPQYVLVFRNRLAIGVRGCAFQSVEPLAGERGGLCRRLRRPATRRLPPHPRTCSRCRKVLHWANVIVQSPTATQWPSAWEDLAESVQAAKAANDSETLSTSVTALYDAVLADGTQWPWLGWAAPTCCRRVSAVMSS